MHPTRSKRHISPLAEMLIDEAPDDALVDLKLVRMHPRIHRLSMNP